jgi:YD repeat-containing protein
MTDALNHQTTFGYNLTSNLTAQTTALNETTNYEYDDFNRVKKIVLRRSLLGRFGLKSELNTTRLAMSKSGLTRQIEKPFMITTRQIGLSKPLTRSIR